MSLLSGAWSALKDMYHAGENPLGREAGHLDARARTAAIASCGNFTNVSVVAQGTSGNRYQISGNHDGRAFSFR